MRRALWACVIVVCFATAAHAFLPVNIENTIKTWFSSAGKLVGFRFFEDNSPPTPKANTCDLYMDAATDSLVASCDGGAATVVVGAASIACNQDGNGNLVCNTLSSLDQNSLASPAANRWRIFDNDVDLTPNPSCLDYGQTGILTVLDVNENAADNYVLCDGNTEIGSLSYSGPATKLTGAWGFGHGGSQTSALTDDVCLCRLFPLQAAIVDLDVLSVIITAADSDANEATTLGVYSFDGLTQYFTGTLTDTATGNVNTTNGTAAPSVMVPADYWFCTGYNQTVNTELRLRSVNGDAQRTAGFSQTCAGGTMPAILTSAAITYTTAVLPQVFLSDE